MTGRLFNIQKFSINDGPGIRTTVFFKGCPLQCKWCSNPESQNRNAAIADAMEDETYSGREYTVEEVMREVRKDKPFYDESDGGMTISGGEVLQQADFAMELADAAKAEGIHVAVETTGYASPARFAAFMEHIDLFLFDFKHVDREAHFAGTGVYNDVILENLQQLLRAGKPVIARIPVIPRFNTSPAAARPWRRICARPASGRCICCPSTNSVRTNTPSLAFPMRWSLSSSSTPRSSEITRRSFWMKG